MKKSKYARMNDVRKYRLFINRQPVKTPFFVNSVFVSCPIGFCRYIRIVSIKGGTRIAVDIG
jgi:hypothetical protein